MTAFLTRHTVFPKPVGIGFYLTILLSQGSCVSPPEPCWGLNTGDHLSIELVELYTPSSSYAYESLSKDTSQPVVLVDSFPSCGSDFDFQVGETIDGSVESSIALDEQLTCLASIFRVDSPQRLAGMFESATSDILSAGQGVIENTDRITIAGCSTYRELSVVPRGGRPGSLSDPVPGEFPPLVLVRAAYLPRRLSDGTCFLDVKQLQLQTCADQFVVRVKIN